MDKNGYKEQLGTMISDMSELKKGIRFERTIYRMVIGLLAIAMILLYVNQMESIIIVMTTL